MHAYQVICAYIAYHLVYREPTCKNEAQIKKGKTENQFRVFHKRILLVVLRINFKAERSRCYGVQREGTE